MYFWMEVTSGALQHYFTTETLFFKTCFACNSKKGRWWCLFFVADTEERWMCITLTNREGLRGPDTQSNFSSSVLLSAKAHSLSVAAHINTRLLTPALFHILVGAHQRYSSAALYSIQPTVNADKYSVLLYYNGNSSPSMRGACVRPTH